MRLAAAALALVALASPSSAAEREVSIPGKVFEPEHLEVLVGDTVTWRNLDATTHTVTADDETFDSGDLRPDGTFSWTFDKPGRTTYHCAIHRFMTGEVDAFAIALSGPGDPVTVGEKFSLHGLARPGNSRVTIERRSGDGTFIEETTASVSEDGRFEAALSALSSTDYRAVVDGISSPVVRVSVTPRITLRARRLRRREILEADASPAQPRMPALVQFYSRERFDWRPFARTRFDAASHLRFVFSSQRKLLLRVLLLRATSGFVGGPSNVVSARGNPMHDF